MTTPDTTATTTTTTIILDLAQVRQLQNELRSQKSEIRKQAEKLGALVEESKDTASGHARKWTIKASGNATEAEKKQVKSLINRHKELHLADESMLSCFNLLADKSDRVAAK